jgi:O-antigen/teichoic acid export membrane protein
MFASVAINSPTEVALAYMRATNRASHYVGASLVRLTLTAVINVFLLVGLRMGLYAMLWGAVWSSSILALALTVYCLRAAKGFSSVDWPLMVGFIRYGVPLGFGGVGFLIIHYGDRFFLKQYVGLGGIGIYSLAYKIGMLITYLQMPFDIYWRAQMFAIVRQPGGDRLYIRVCTYLALALAAFVVFLAIFAAPILHFAVGHDFIGAAPYVAWIAVAYAIRTIGSHFRNAFLLTGQTQREAAVVWIGAVVCLGGYAFLIPRYTIWGAVAATVIAFSVMFVLSLWQSQRVRHFAFEFKRLTTIAILSAGTILAYAWLQPAEPGRQALAGAAIMAAYVGFFFVSRFFFSDEIAAARQLWRRLVVKRLDGASA